MTKEKEVSAKSYDDYYNDLHIKKSHFKAPITHIAGFLGALQLVSLLREIIAWKQFILEMVQFWVAITRPLAEFLFSWLYRLFSIEISDFLLDYTVFGVVLFMGQIRNILLSSAAAKTIDTSADYSIDGEQKISSSYSELETLTGNLLYFIIPMSIISLVIWPIIAFASVFCLVISLPIKFGWVKILSFTVSEEVKNSNKGRPRILGAGSNRRSKDLEDQLREEYEFFGGLFNFGWAIAAPFAYLIIFVIFNYALFFAK